MTPDSQCLQIEHTRRELADWLIRQPGFDHYVSLACRHKLRTAIDTLGMREWEIVEAIGRAPGSDALRKLLSEDAFGMQYNEETLFDLYAEGPGRDINGLSFRYLRRLADASPTLWRVIDVQRGISIRVEPWGGGVAVVVHDRTHASSVGVGDLLVTRMIDMPAGPMFGIGMISFSHVAHDAMTDSPAGVGYWLSQCVLALLAPTEIPASAKEDTVSDDRQAGQPQTRADRERLLERVRKLFAMAQQSDASPHEAEIALRRCQSLMAKFGISEADLETSAFGNVEVTSGRTVPMHVKYLASAVSKLHDVLFVTGNGGFAEFRGFEVDANVARLTLEYLLDAVERALATRKRAGDFPAGRSAAYDYRMGFATEVSRRVKELVAERNKTQQQSAGTGTTLTVRKREIVERECGQDLGRSTFRQRGTRDATARAAGTDDGARVSLDQQVGSTPGPATLPKL